MAKVTLDTLDRRLIEMLAEDARISNRQIASALNVTEGTVRGRIKRLERDNLIRFTAVTTLQKGARCRLAFIRIQAELDRVADISAILTQEQNVGALLITMGQFNLLAIVLFEELEDLHALASGKILAMPGVHHVETAIGIDTVKYDVRVARIL